MRGATGTPLRSGAANSMKTCLFDEIDLRGGTSILVDLTSLQKFADDFRSKWLTDERVVSVYADKLTDGDPGVSSCLRFLVMSSALTNLSLTDERCIHLRTPSFY